MGLIDTLVEAQSQTIPVDISTAAGHILLSHYDTAAERQAFVQTEAEIFKGFDVLVSGRKVVKSVVQWAPIGGMIFQTDIFDPIKLHEGSLKCFPYRGFDHVRNIPGKLEELAGDMDKISPIARAGWQLDWSLKENEYGFMITNREAQDVDKSRPFRVHEKTPKDISKISRPHLHDVQTGFTGSIGTERQENQALFKQFLEELLVHEGFMQTPVPTWVRQA